MLHAISGQSLKADLLDQAYQPREARTHVGRKRRDLLSNGRIENLDRPGHAGMVIAKKRLCPPSPHAAWMGRSESRAARPAFRFALCGLHVQPIAIGFELRQM